MLFRSPDIDSASITSISTDDLYLLFELYDSEFFGNWFKDFYRGIILFSLSKRMNGILNGSI